MAQLVIEFPNESFDRVLSKFGARHRYNQLKNPEETQEDFLKRKILDFIRSSVLEAERSEAMVAARQQVKDDLNF